MAFGARNSANEMQVSVDRLAAVAGAPAQTVRQRGGAVAAPQKRRAGLHPDPSRIRRRQTDESEEDRKRRLAAKTVNFTATFIARLVIIGAAGYWVWNQYQYTGQIHRGIAVGVFVMFGDLGRVILKASEHGTK